MAKACLFIAFNRPVRGSESAAMALFEEALGQFESFQREGWFESFDVIGLTPHFGTTNSFILLKGDRAKLDELRRTDVFERLSMRFARVVEGYGVVPGVTREGFDGVKQRHQDLFK